MKLDTDSMIWRSICLAPIHDEKISLEAKQSNRTKGEVFRHYLESGMKLLPNKEIFPKNRIDHTILVALRPMYVPVNVDEILRVQTYRYNSRRDVLIYHYLEKAMQSLTV